MTNVILTSNLRLIAELDKCGAPKDRFFTPSEINGVKYDYRYYFKPGVFDVDDFIREMQNNYFTLDKNGDRVPFDASRYWDEIVDGKIPATYHYYIDRE